AGARGDHHREALLAQVVDCLPARVVDEELHGVQRPGVGGFVPPPEEQLVGAGVLFRMGEGGCSDEQAGGGQGERAQAESKTSHGSVPFFAYGRLRQLWRQGRHALGRSPAALVWTEAPLEAPDNRRGRLCPDRGTPDEQGRSWPVPGGWDGRWPPLRFGVAGGGTAAGGDGPAGDLSRAVQAGEQQPAGGPDDELQRDADGEEGAEEAAHRRPGEHPFEDLEGDEGSG